MRRTLILGTALALAFTGCDDGSGPVGIDDTGTVMGLAYVDRDGSRSITAVDAAAQGVAAALVLQATGDTVARATTDAQGAFVMTDIPVGRYRLTARLGTIGDTLAIEAVVDPEVSVAAGDTAVRSIRLSYPVTAVANIRTLPAGRRVIAAGIALNGWATYGDSTVHIRDATGVIRAVRVFPSTVQAGDSVRVLGTTGTAGGYVVLADAGAAVAAPARGLPAVDSAATGAAARAEGVQENGQVRVAGALVLDTATVAGDRILGIDDGSGRLEVVLDRNVQFDAGSYIPGATFRGAGLLVPGSAAGAWRLKPRDRTEAVISFAAVAVATARAAAAGTRLVVEGLALNAWSAFADSTVHLADASGAIRAVRVTGNVAAGDSIRVLGTIETRDGQPVFSGATAVVVRAGVGLPLPDSVGTATAAGADDGVLDAAQVRVGGTIVSSQLQANGDLLLGIDDGSGRLDVLFDRDIPGFNTASFVPGALLGASGVLVPTGTGSWRLKPRRAADATATFPTVTLAEARALEAGRTVYVHGIALNGWVTFADSTIHLQDPTDAIRIVRLPPASVFAGDSVRILGTIAVQRGQPVLIGSTTAVLLTGVGVPAPDSISTTLAAAADGGARDAELVVVAGTIGAVQNLVTGDVALSIDDGSGVVRVLLDRDVGFSTGAYTGGQAVRVRGVLVPNAAGTAWEVKPRTVSDVTLGGS